MGALLPHLFYIVLAPAENTVFLGYGEAWNSRVGVGLGQRLLLLQQQGQNSRKEEGPDEPLSQPLLGCRAGSSWALLCSMGKAAGIRPPQPEPCTSSCSPCFSLPQEVASVIGVVSEARAVLASILPSHRGQLWAVYLLW